MISRFKDRVGNVIFVFLLILAFLIVDLIIEFNYIDFAYAIVVVIYMVRYLKLKLS